MGPYPAAVKQLEHLIGIQTSLLIDVQEDPVFVMNDGPGANARSHA